MNDYRQVRLTLQPCCETATDIAAALLADIGYESFVPDSQGLTAYIPAGAYNAEILQATLAEFPMPGVEVRVMDETLVEGQDWNAEWERHYFQPIVVGQGAEGESCVVHSSFHTDIPPAAYDIVIDPKMAFGTGHHATTSLILEQLLRLPLEGQSVVDMGTGSGILAILCAMRGAKPVTAIEIDPFAEANARENVAANGHAEIRVVLGDATVLASVEPADLFIANINRNIITGDIASYAATLNTGGLMLLSGFYERDIPVVEAAARPYGLQSEGHTVKGDNWTCLRLRKI